MKKTSQSIFILLILSLTFSALIINFGFQDGEVNFESFDNLNNDREPILAQNVDNTQIQTTKTPITTDPSDQSDPAIYGDRIVWVDYRNDNYDIYMYDLSTDTEIPITTDPSSQWYPAIYGDRIVWEDYRNGNWDIYMYDLSTDTETQITTDPWDQWDPAIYGDRIVWIDDRNGNWDIYMYDLSTDTEIPIITDFGYSMWDPAIYGDRIVWIDDRNGNWDIYTYDLSTDTETPITTDPFTQSNPAIYGDRIVWVDDRNGNWNGDIYMYDLSTGTETQITTDPLNQYSPAIYGDRIVWVDDRNGNYDIYMREFPHLIYGTNFGPVNLDPHKAWEISSIDVIDQVVETLYAYDLSDPELAITPRLALDYGTWSEGGLNYTIPLRRGVTFHDGTLFDATAVKWNFDRLAYFMNLDGPLPPEIPTTPFSTLYLWQDGTPIINSVIIVDEYTVRFVLNKPFAPFEALLSFSGSGIMSPASTPPQNYIDTATGDLVGTGPFVYDNYEVDLKVTMHGYENYWKGAPYIDELTFSIIQDTDERNQALLDGTIDFIKTPDISRLQEFRDDPDITLVDAGQDAAIWFLGMNNRIINVSFREAISYAIDYTYMIDELLGGEAVRLKSPIPLGIMYANWSFNAPILNLTRARQVMQSMGFGVGFDVNNDADWVNQESTSPFAIFNYSYIFGTFREDILVLLQDDLSKIGIRVTGAGMTGQEFFGKLLDIPPHSKNQLELFWLGWFPDYSDPSNIINNLFSKNSVSNFAQVDDDLVQEWMEEALITINPAERKVLYDKIQQRLIEVVFPWAWGYVRRNYDAHSNDFIGFQSNPLDKVWFYSVDKDTDGDRLSDYEEINTYGTNPFNSDTDGDGISDGDEVKIYGTNPLKPVDTYTPIGTNIEVIDENTGTSIEFENIETPGVTTIEESEIEPEIPGGFMIAGLPGTYISITTTASYSGSMIIGIPYDGSMLSVEEENYLVLWHWNSTTNQWEDSTLFVDTGNNIIYGEVESLSIFTIILDIAPPSISVETPSEGQALQDGITFKIKVADSSEIDSVTISIRELGVDQVFVGVATHVIDDEWLLTFDTTVLPDGYYQIIVEASDVVGNTASTSPLSVSIRNWATLELLPATVENKAGRTMPIKFSLRVVEAVDPAMPFVRNEELDIKIFDKSSGQLLQHSTFGDTSTDYRIHDENELYITNFKTSKIPATYVVAIYRKGMFIGSFEFTTFR